MDDKKIQEQIEAYTDIYNQITALYNDPSDMKPAFEYLLSVKNKVEKEFYGFCLRKLYTMVTNGVPKELVVELFRDVKHEDVMYSEELKEMNAFEEVITIYRGASRQENIPRTSWSLKKYVAEDFSQGRLFVTKKDFDWAVETATKKKKLDCSLAEYFTIDEGLCVQMMHRGSFDDEPVTVEIMNSYIAENGFVNDFSDARIHHEIYLSDARKVMPEKQKTVIRHPIRKA